MPRPRRILWSLLKAAATLLFVLGLTLLVAWPVSYWSAFYFEFNDEDQTKWTPRDGDVSLPGVSSTSFAVSLYSGRMWASGGTFSWSEESATESWRTADPSRDFTPDFHFALGDPGGGGTDWWFWQRVEGAEVDIEGTSVTLGLPLPLPAALLLSPALLWLALAWRRRRRTQYRLASGLCLHCGYSLHGLRGVRGGDAVACPECGAARPMVTYDGGASTT